MFIVFCIIAVILGILRVAGIKTLLFQALAHLFVGFGFGVWLGGGKYYPYLFVAIALSLLELVCFLIGVGK